MNFRIRLPLFGGLLCAALAVPGAAPAQIAPEGGQPFLTVGVEMGMAAIDGRHAINAAPLFLTPGIEVRTRGRFFAFAGVRALVFAIPISGDGGDRVTDKEGNSGFRHTGGMGGGPWVRGGIGAALTRSPRSPTVSIAGGTMGVSDPHPWVGGAVGVPVRGAWRVEAEVGWDRNWVEDSFVIVPREEPTEPFVLTGYTRRTEEWFNTLQLGVRYRL